MTAKRCSTSSSVVLSSQKRPAVASRRAPFCASCSLAQRVRRAPQNRSRTASRRAPFCASCLLAQRARRAPQNRSRTASRRAPFCASSLVDRLPHGHHRPEHLPVKGQSTEPHNSGPLAQSGWHVTGNSYRTVFKSKDAELTCTVSTRMSSLLGGAFGSRCSRNRLPATANCNLSGRSQLDCRYQRVADDLENLLSFRKNRRPIPI